MKIFAGGEDWDQTGRSAHGIGKTRQQAKAYRTTISDCRAERLTSTCPYSVSEIFQFTHANKKSLPGLAARYTRQETTKTHFSLVEKWASVPLARGRLTIVSWAVEAEERDANSVGRRHVVHHVRRFLLRGFLPFPMFMFLPNPTAPAQTNSRPIKSAPGHLVAVHAWRSRLSARSILVAWLDWNLDLNLTDALARASGVDVAGTRFELWRGACLLKFLKLMA